MTAPRGYTDYLVDIVSAMQKIGEFIADMTLDQFVMDDKTNYAVIRALEVIGEATKQVPVEIVNRYPEVPWKRMAGMRDRLIHGYFGVDAEIVWETANTLIPTVLPDVMRVVLTEQQAARQDNKQSS